MAENRTDWLRIAASVLLLLLLGYVLWRVRGVLVTVLLALVMAYVLRPLVSQLCRVELKLGRRTWRVPRALAVALVYLALAVMLWCVWMIGADAVKRQFMETQNSWPEYQAALTAQAKVWEGYLHSLPQEMQKTIDTWVAGLPSTAGEAVKKGVSATLKSVLMLIELLLVPILAFYILADGRSIRRQVLFFVPRRYLDWTEHALDRADDAFQRFIRAQVILCLIAFVVVTVGLWLVDLDFYLLLGVIAGVTRAIPVIGPVAGAIPILLVLLLAHKSLAFLLWFLFLFTLLHALESKLLMPAVLGRQLDLHPVLIIVALLIGAQFGGLLGMFLAPPVLAVIRTLMADRRNEEVGSKEEAYSG